MGVPEYSVLAPLVLCFAASAVAAEAPLAVSPGDTLARRGLTGLGQRVASSSPPSASRNQDLAPAGCREPGCKARLPPTAPSS
jgi:hypothetical protein